MLLCNRGLFKLPPHCMVKNICMRTSQSECFVVGFLGISFSIFPLPFTSGCTGVQYFCSNGWLLRKLNFGHFRWKMVTFFVLHFLKGTQLGVWRMSWPSSPKVSLLSFFFLSFFPNWFNKIRHGSGQVERTDFSPLQPVYTEPCKFCYRLQYCLYNFLKTAG